MDEELDIFQDTTAEETFRDTTVMAAEGAEEEEGRMYDYTNQREDGGSQNLYWGNVSRQVTEDELRELYNADDNARLRESFGTFDNYLAYMNERQDLIDAGEYKADWWDTGAALVSEETLADREAGMDDKEFERGVIEEGARLGEEGYNAQKDVFQDLYEKYTGESTTKYLDNGAKYEWNGTSFVLTQEAYGFHFGSFVGNVLPMIVVSAGMPASAFGGGFFGGAAKGAIGSAIGQGIANGKIDPDQLLQSAVLGGIGGFFDDLVAAEPGVYGGWIVDGKVVGEAGQWSIEKIQFLSDKLGIPFNEAAGIVEGILTGAVTGEDLEGIAINAVGGWTDAKVSEFIQDTFGDAGLDVENFFREGETNISTEAIQGLASNGIQALIDGGMSDADAVGVFYDFFVEGGSIDFLWPALGELDIDLGSFDFDFCSELPLLCAGGAGLAGLNLPEVCKKDAAGEKPWYCGIDFEGTDVNLGEIDVDLPPLKCPTIDVVNGKMTYKWDSNLGECVPDVVECIEGFDFDGQTCVEVKIDGPEGPDIDLGCPKTDVENGKQTYVRNELGECIPDIIECIPGFELQNQTCVEIPSPCPIGQTRNPETGECEEIEGPEKPEGPDVDGPDMDLPSFGIGANTFEGAFTPFQSEARGYMGPAVPSMLAPPPQKDYTAELNTQLDSLIQRNLGGMFKGMG